MLLKLLALSSLGVLFTLVAAAIPSKTSNRCEPEVDLRKLNIKQCFRTEAELGLSRAEGKYTNGQRLSMGLPLKPPSRRSRNKVSRADPSATPLFKGYLKAYSDSTFLGYVQDTLPYGGYYYGALSLTNMDGNLIVGYNTDDQASGLSLDLQTFNGPYSTHEAYFGAVDWTAAGDAVLGPGLSSHVYSTATNQTPRNAEAENVGNSLSIEYQADFNSESNMWFVDSNTNAVTAVWTNPDGGRVLLEILHIPSEQVLVLTGDAAAFANGNLEVVTLVFESISG